MPQRPLQLAGRDHPVEQPGVEADRLALDRGLEVHRHPGDQTVDVPLAHHPGRHLVVPGRAVEVGEGESLSLDLGGQPVPDRPLEVVHRGCGRGGLGGAGAAERRGGGRRGLARGRPGGRVTVAAGQREQQEREQSPDASARHSLLTAFVAVPRSDDRQPRQRARANDRFRNPQDGTRCTRNGAPRRWCDAQQRHTGAGRARGPARRPRRRRLRSARRRPTRSARPGSPTAPATARRSPASTTRDHRVVCTRDSASTIAAMPAGALRRRNQQLLGECALPLDPDRDQLDQEAATRRSTSCPACYTRARSGRTRARPTTARTCKTSRRTRCRPRSTSASPHRPGRRRRTGVQPDRALVRRPAPLRPQPEPDRDLRRPHARQRLDPLRQRVLRHPDRRHRPRRCRRRDRQPVHQAQRDPRRPAGGVYLRNFTVQQSEFNALYVLETDGFVHRPRDRARQRRVRHPRVRQRPRADPAHQRLLQRRLRASTPARAPTSTPTTPSFKPVRYAIEIRAQPQPPQHARLLAARPGTRSRRTTTSSTTTPPASPRTRCSPATPACRRTTPGGTTTGSTPTTRTGTPSTSTRASATSRWRSAATSTARSARWSRPRSAPAC